MNLNFLTLSNLTISDATIAAVALHHKVTLVIANVRGFPMKERTIYPL
jgi:predicted nucleic acid-binding protein